MSFGVEEVVSRGLCVGCGGCSVRTSGAIPVTIGRYGVYQANVKNATAAELEVADRVCPFSDKAKNENVLAEERFSSQRHDAKIGHYMEAFAGRVTDSDRLRGSSSGGLTSFVIEELFRAGEIDALIHVGRGSGTEMFEYRISRSTAQIVADRKSFYYASTLAGILEEVKRAPGRYAIIGVPCFIKASRLLADEDAVLAERLKLFVGILCGHLKSQFYAESLGWQSGFSPAELDGVDFRVKNPDKPSNRYDYEATSTGGKSVTRSMSAAIDGSWGYGAFQPEACNFCDDIFAETADVVFGDAWLPEYRADWRGTNVVVVRNERVRDLLHSARDDGRVQIDQLTPERAAKTQAGNFRHRWEGQSVRLADDIAAGLPVPIKRVAPGYPVPTRRITLIRHRRVMSRLSLTSFAQAKEAGDLNLYVRPMRAAIRKYGRLDAASKGRLSYAKYALKSAMKWVLGLLRIR